MDAPGQLEVLCTPVNTAVRS